SSHLIFFILPAPPALYPLSLHDALPISRYLLDLAAGPAGAVGGAAVFAAVLADSVTVWPELLRLARNTAVLHETRRSTVFWLGQDRKSTRLNSSHVAISYAVFCLKKKKR